MSHPEERFWRFVWRITNRPLKYCDQSPLEQSAAAAGINIWCLALVLLGQLWVFFSAGLLLAQTYNTWLVANGRLSPASAVLWGIVILLVNLGALPLAILAQFWVGASTALACWQFVSLIRSCADVRRRGAFSAAAADPPDPSAAGG
jgi:hypothetical protein